MASAELRLVGSQTGELIEGTIDWCRARIVQLEADLEAVERERRQQRAHVKRLMNEAEERRKAQAALPQIEAIFDVWRKHSGHTRSKLGPKRFDAIYGRLKDGYSVAVLKLAAAGVGFDPFCKQRKNGTVERFDDIELAMRNEVNVERFACRAPADVRRELSGQLFETEGQE